MRVPPVSRKSNFRPERAAAAGACSGGYTQTMRVAVGNVTYHEDREQSIRVLFQKILCIANVDAESRAMRSYEVGCGWPIEHDDDVVVPALRKHLLFDGCF